MYRENNHPAGFPELFSEEKGIIEHFFCLQRGITFFELSDHTLWIVKKGAFSITFSHGKKEIIQNGQLFFLPAGTLCTFTMTQASQLTGIHLPDCVALCEYFLPPGLSGLKEHVNSSFNPLELVPLVWEYTRHVNILFEECRLTAFFHRLKIYELFYILSHCYTDKELAGLFYPALKRENAFAEFVYTHYMHVRTVQELANAAHMSLKSFENQFNQVFGISPGRWLIGEKRKKYTVKLQRPPFP